MPIVAGTIPCPTCYNQPKVRRHTPNFARVFRMEDPWWFSVRFHHSPYSQDSQREILAPKRPQRAPDMIAAHGVIL